MNQSWYEHPDLDPPDTAFPVLFHFVHNNTITNEEKKDRLQETSSVAWRNEAKISKNFANPSKRMLVNQWDYHSIQGQI
jgi:hypothetical protein